MRIAARRKSRGQAQHHGGDGLRIRVGIFWAKAARQNHPQPGEDDDPGRILHLQSGLGFTR